MIKHILCMCLIYLERMCCFMAKKGVLTEKQKLFAEEYLKDLNATRAYKEIYKCKTDKTAKVNGCRLLTNANLQTYIKGLIDKIHDEKIATAEEVMEYLTKVLRGESKSEIVVIEGTGDGCSSARTMEKTPDEKERTKAAELIGKRYGIFTENFKTNGVVSVQIINDLEEDDPDEDSG